MMHTKSKIIQKSEDSRNPMYRLQYDLVDCNGTVVKEQVYVWDTRMLSTALMLEKVIDKQGLRLVEQLHDKAVQMSKGEKTNRFTKHLDVIFDDLLEEFICVLA